MATFSASLVLPERVLLEQDVESVMLRTDVGDAAFLPGHTPLMGAVVAGSVRFVSEGGAERRFEVQRGLVHVEPDRVIVLTPEAEEAG